MPNPCDLAEESAALGDDVASAILTEDNDEAGPITDTGGNDGVIQNVAETAVLDDGYDERPSIHLTEVAILNDAVSIGVEVSDNLVEVARLSDATQSKLEQEVAETAELGDATASVVGANIVEVATLGDAVSISVSVEDDLVEVAVLSDAAIGVARTHIEETATLNDAVQQSLNAISLISEVAALGDAVLSGAVVSTLVEEVAELGDAVQTLLYATNNLVEQATLDDRVIGGGNAAWTAHVEPWAMSRFENFPWNSMAVIGGALFAAGPEGVYQLTGNDDDGAQIDAQVDHDWLSKTAGKEGEVPNKHLKRPRYLYLEEVRADGEVELNLGYATIEGAVAEAEYPLPEVSATGFVNTRVALGRGIRSQHLRPSIRNVDGADFEYGAGRIVVDSLARNL